MPKLSEILGAEAFKALPDEVKTQYGAINLVDDKQFVAVEKYNNEVTAKNTLQSQLTERDTQLTNLKKDLGGKDVKEISKLIEELEGANKEAKTTFDQQLEAQKLNFAIELGLRDAGAKNAKAVLGLLKADAITLNGDKLIGLEEQLKGLKGSDAYLFNEAVDVGSGGLGNHQRTKGQENTDGFGERLGKQQAEINKAPAENPYFK